MLFSLGLELPETILPTAGGLWARARCPSPGERRAAADLIEQHGVDAVRYYLMSEMNLDRMPVLRRRIHQALQQ